MRASKCGQLSSQLSRLHKLLSSDDSDRQRGVVKSISVSISITQPRTPDVDTEEMSISRRSPSLMAISTSADHPRWWRLHDLSVTSLWLERRFLVALLVLGRADHSTSQVLTISHVVFITTFYWRLASKKPPHSAISLLIGSTAVTSHAAVTSDARSIQISSQNSRVRC